jgi:hypothetical protein
MQTPHRRNILQIHEEGDKILKLTLRNMVLKHILTIECRGKTLQKSCRSLNCSHDIFMYLRVVLCTFQISEKICHRHETPQIAKVVMVGT